jgi:hypothetical protein
MKSVEDPSTTWRQPVPAESLAWLDETVDPIPEDLDTDPRIEYVGRVRVPIAGPYRPWARLYRLPDGRSVWIVRLWDRHQAVRRVASTSTLLAFARLSQLPALAARIGALDRRGRSGV